MRRVPAVAILGLAVVAGVLAGPPRPLPPATAKAYEDFKTQYRHPNEGVEPVNRLAAAVDGDWCFLEFASDHGGEQDYRWLAARDQLARLNTQRTFDAIMTMLDSPNDSDRTLAAELLYGWKRPEAVPKLLARLSAADGKSWERDSAVETLKTYHDPRIEPAVLKLVDDPQTGFRARSLLAARQYEPAYAVVMAALDKVSPDLRPNAIADVAAYRRPASVERLLVEMRSLDQSPSGSFLKEWTHVRLCEMLATAEPVLGPLPDPIAEEWDDYWAAAKPLLTADLTLKHPPQPPPKYAPEQYAVDADRVTFTATADRATYRVGEPIRLDFRLANTGDRPVSVIVPRPPSRASSIMAYGVRLKRGDATLIDFPPSDFYLGSYGPPPFETVGPRQTTDGSACLQGWLYMLQLPLAEGDYELTVTYDPAKFPGVHAKGVHRLRRWEATSIRFTVRGPAVNRPEQLLAEIAAKTNRKFLLRDLTSEQPGRQNPAWQAVLDYGDRRLLPFFDRFKQEHPDNAADVPSADEFRPFERPARDVKW